MQRYWLSHYEKGVATELTIPSGTLPDDLAHAVSQWPDRPALTLLGKTLTYRHLDAAVRQFANALYALGVRKDSKVAIWLPNLPQSVISFYATLRLGAQVVNTNPLYVERELEFQFNDARVSHVITVDFLYAGRLRAMRHKTGVQKVVVTSIPDYLPFPLNLIAPFKLKRAGQYVPVAPEPDVHSFKTLMSTPYPAAPQVETSADDIAVLQYTGGTTGVSKAAMLSHRNLLANAAQCSAWFAVLKPGHETLLACLPYFHVFGMTVSMIWPVHTGAHAVVVPNPRDIAAIIKGICKYRATVLPAVPAHFMAIADHPTIAKYNLRSLRACFCGSAPLSVDVLQRFEKMTGAIITEGFGMTETGPVTHINPLYGVRKAGTVGLPVPSTDVRIVDLETGTRELPLGQAGELCVRGPQVMRGYWQRPDETALALHDGFMHTGDIATMDAEGYTTIVGRKKDMVLASGYNVYPDEIDQVLTAHPAVLEAATIGVPDPKRGETLKSFVVLKAGHQATPDELRRYCKEQLAAYKVPRQIELLEALPKSPILKVLRRELRDRETASRNSDVAQSAV